MSSKAFNEKKANNAAPAKKTDKPRAAWKFFIIPAVLIIGVIVLACALLLPSLSGEQATEAKLMQKYYSNLYSTDGDIAILPECMPEELRAKYEQISTLGGVSTNILVTYRKQMLEKVGENMATTTQITSTKNAGSQKLAAIKKQFRDAEMVETIEFDVTVKGDAATEEMEGTTEIVRINGQWFLTTYNLLLNKKA